MGQRYFQAQYNFNVSSPSLPTSNILTKIVYFSSVLFLLLISYFVCFFDAYNNFCRMPRSIMLFTQVPLDQQLIIVFFLQASLIVHQPLKPRTRTAKKHVLRVNFLPYTLSRKQVCTHVNVYVFSTVMNDVIARFVGNIVTRADRTYSLIISNYG